MASHFKVSMRSRSATPTRIPNLHVPRLTIFQDGVGECENDDDDDDDDDGDDVEITVQINHPPRRCW